MRALKDVVESIKSGVESDLIQAVQEKKLNIDPAHLPAIVQHIKLSIENGYQRSYNVVVRTVSSILEKAKDGSAKETKSPGGKDKKK